MSTILLEIYYVSSLREDLAMEEYWALSRRLGLLCHYVNKGTFNVGPFNFENGGVVRTAFKGRPGLTLVVNEQYDFTHPNNFNILDDYTVTFNQSQYSDCLYYMVDVLRNHPMFNRLVPLPVPTIVRNPTSGLTNRSTYVNETYETTVNVRRY
jgi:hypothetical protein